MLLFPQPLASLHDSVMTMNQRHVCMEYWNRNRDVVLEQEQGCSIGTGTGVLVLEQDQGTRAV